MVLDSIARRRARDGVVTSQKLKIPTMKKTVEPIAVLKVQHPVKKERKDRSKAVALLKLQNLKRTVHKASTDRLKLKLLQIKHILPPCRLKQPRRPLGRKYG
jgi:hypothetical protein